MAGVLLTYGAFVRFILLATPSSIHTRRWVRLLEARGHDVVIVPNSEAPSPRLMGLARWARHQLQLRLLARQPGSLLVVHWIPRGWRAMALLGIHPRVGVAWGSDVFLPDPNQSDTGTLRLRLQARFLHGCDAVFGTSDAVVRAAIARGAQPSRTSTVRFGIDLKRFRPGPDPLALRTRFGLLGKRVVLSNRTIAPIYRQPTVVEALAQLPPDAVAVMTRHRADPAELQRIERLARELGVEARLLIVDELSDEDLPDLYRLASVVVSVPESDGGASTVSEALGCGCPVVASDLPSAREWLGNLDPDGLVPVADAAATARAIERALARTPEERADVARRNRAAVVEGADEQRAVDALEAVHRRLVRSGG